MSQKRPLGVTVVAVLAWITGVLQILAGIVPITKNDVPVGVVMIVIGIATIIVSLGLFRGNNVARVLVTLLFLINIAAAIYAAVAQRADVWSWIGAVALPLIGIVLLFTRRANAFFRG